MKKFIYVLLGITTGVVIKPIIDKFINAILVWIETLAIKPTKKILNFHKDTTIIREFINDPVEQCDYDMYYYEDLD